MSMNDSMLLSLPPEILSNILTFLSPRAAVQLEISSKTAEAAVLRTEYWRKQAESLSETSKSHFARNLLVKVTKHGYVSPAIFKMIVRGSKELDTVVRELKSFMWDIRDQISRIALLVDHDERNPYYDDDWNDPEDDECNACLLSSSLFDQTWKLKIFPVEKKLEMAKLVKDFIVEGIADINLRFVHTKKGPEPTIRQSCFEVRQSSACQIGVYCTVDILTYPEGFDFANDHQIWCGENDYESGDSDDSDDESREDDVTDEEIDGFGLEDNDNDD
eukprot:GFUD01043866.1.p1 GENE.GFUD01043866.1~~GFUD01043866.1.p1  ORF type:complete len:275 (-),score=76.39 GFUD01043866.1:69-893(-)